MAKKKKYTPPTLSWTKVTPPALQFNIQLRVQTHFKRLFHQRVIVNRVNLFIPFTFRFIFSQFSVYPFSFYTLCIYRFYSFDALNFPALPYTSVATRAPSAAAALSAFPNTRYKYIFYKSIASVATVCVYNAHCFIFHCTSRISQWNRIENEKQSIFNFNTQTIYSVQLIGKKPFTLAHCRQTCKCIRMRMCMGVEWYFHPLANALPHPSIRIAVGVMPHSWIFIRFKSGDSKFILFIVIASTILVY